MSPVDLLLGPTFVGTIINVFLFGVMCVQCTLYFTTFKQDRKGIKSLVWFLFGADTINTGFLVAVLYGDVITHFGDLGAAQHTTWPSTAGPLLNTIIATVVQAFFARRVYLLTTHRWVVLPICALIFIQFVGGMIVSVMTNIVTNVVQWNEPRVKIPLISSLVIGAVVDCLITGALTWSLRQAKTGFSVTDDLVTKLIRLTVQTGLVTAVVAVVDLIMFLSSPYPFHLITGLILAKLYTNSLLSTLNARLTINQSSYQTHGGHVITDGNWPTKDIRGAGATSGIQVQVTTEVDRDEYELAEAKSRMAQMDSGDQSPLKSTDNLDIESGGKGYAIKWANTT
ncbi:hypothetical protein JAAARDRAFT_41643 [Jaapia argillacea MUCL 33604]|uniref:DUF6534 domain-containing protein n=1 Tax=Jaapia argillacea MUCL 33604 TaxID=933084 RepID=A0A067PK80_9AGAM|nr:hypothetical protein JAAARDRAFT_41643 [Jaapia argillacea MUCL 33604]